MGSMIVLHWLVSQSIFIVPTHAYGPGPEDYRLLEFDNSRIGYSSLAMFIASWVGVGVIFFLTLNNTVRVYRSVPGWLIRQATNSTTISALCHRPDKDTDAPLFPVKLGAVYEDPTEDTGCVQRITFSTDTEIQSPVQERMYQQPVLS